MAFFLASLQRMRQNQRRVPSTAATNLYRQHSGCRGQAVRAEWQAAQPRSTSVYGTYPAADAGNGNVRLTMQEHRRGQEDSLTLQGLALRLTDCHGKRWALWELAAAEVEHETCVRGPHVDRAWLAGNKACYCKPAGGPVRYMALDIVDHQGHKMRLNAHQQLEVADAAQAQLLARLLQGRQFLPPNKPRFPGPAHHVRFTHRKPA